MSSGAIALRSSTAASSRPVAVEHASASSCSTTIARAPRGPRTLHPRLPSLRGRLSGARAPHDRLRVAAATTRSEPATRYSSRTSSGVSSRTCTRARASRAGPGRCAAGPAADREPDRGQHPPHLALAPLRHHEPDRAPRRPLAADHPHRGGVRRAVVELDPAPQPRDLPCRRRSRRPRRGTPSRSRSRVSRRFPSSPSLVSRSSPRCRGRAARPGTRGALSAAGPGCRARPCGSCIVVATPWACAGRSTARRGRG